MIHLDRIFAALATLAVSTSLLAGCVGAPDSDVDEQENVEEAEQDITIQDCYSGYNYCEARCARLERRGIDASQCHADCGATLNTCVDCRNLPYACYLD